jgi:hypothetical protein
VLYILYIPLSYLFWIGEIVWMDFLCYNVYHKGEMDLDVGKDEGGRVGGVREEDGEDGNGGDEDGEVEQDEWQDTDEDEDEDEDEDGDGDGDRDEKTTEEVQRPSAPPQQIGIENEKVDSVMAGRPDRGKGASTAWDEGASPKPRNGYIGQRDDKFGLE